MKRLFAILCLAFVLGITGCATQTLLDKEVIAMKSVTAAREVATAALRAGKITLGEDQATQANLTLIATGIKAAVAAQDATTVAAKKAEADAIKTKLEAK